MKIGIKIVLLVVAGFLAYKVYDSIASEIKYMAEVERIEADVIARLEKIRELQMIYRDEKGTFAPSFDSLTYFAEHGTMKIIREYGDRDDSTTVFRQEIELVSIKDSMFKNYPLDSLSIVPHNPNGAKFILNANVIEQNNVKVPVFEIKDPEPFSRDRKHKDALNPLTVGSLTEVKYSGNWK
jgi:hypothetical protein